MSSSKNSRQLPCTIKNLVVHPLKSYKEAAAELKTNFFKAGLMHKYSLLVGDQCFLL